MQSKKRVSMLIALAVVSIMLLGFASASFWDIFKLKIGSQGGEGELATSYPAKATANVTASSNPPVIYFVSKPYAPLTGSLVNLNPSPSTTSVTFSFIALEDPENIGPDSGCGSVGLTPGVNPGEAVSPVGNFIKGNFSAPSNESTRAIVSCYYVNTTQVNWGGLCPAKNYSCNVTSQYYDRGERNGFYWNMSVQILQTSNGVWSSSSYWASSNQSFQYVDVFSITLVPASINWTNPPLVIGDFNSTSNNNVNIFNMGNINLSSSINDFRINATRLNLTSGNDFLASNNFTADDDASPCDQPSFADDVNVSLMVDVGKYLSGSSGSDQKNVTFCAKTVPTNIQTGIYESRRNWDITIG